MLVIATHNSHKTDEIRAMLSDVAKSVTDLTQFPGIPPADETGTTFVANATIKALAACDALPKDSWVLADDSGLEVDALNGAPGIYSARYSGEHATDATNRVKLLSELGATGARGKERSARFRCVLVLARNGEVVASCDGSVEGIITNEGKGGGGFGYDPLFVPEGHCATFAELSAEVKNSLSHRARAVEALRQVITKQRLILT
ncbi:MAG: RdgB/HAM1 family non-canonical purine NTP pyrophosphatase [Verrucomicrobia bacterium]|nr:RdgB/HAM1 family non-canonical purine NTP pyrophosphatase [Verrucomicrobiota bacterium]